MTTPLLTVVVPSYNQGQFLDQALSSIFAQKLPMEVFVVDGGSTDNTLEIISHWHKHLSGWRSHPDRGQSAAINEGIAKGKAPYVAWLNSDDWYLPDALIQLFHKMEQNPKTAVVYGKALNFKQTKQVTKPVWTEPFNKHRLAQRCFIAQPATLIRRAAWEKVGGLAEHLHMAMDYELWWKLFKYFGEFQFVDAFIAVNREHNQTKTQTQRRLHYQEAMEVVRSYYGRIPLKWWLYQPYSVWFKTWCGHFRQ